MDEEWYRELVDDMAAFVPDQNWEQILTQLVRAMVACNGKLTSAEMGQLIAVAAAIKRLGEGTARWWEL